MGDEHEARERFRALVETVPAITYVRSADASGTFAYVSPQVRTIFGVDPATWLADPRHRNEWLHPDDRERVLAEEARAVATGEPIRMEYRMRVRGAGYVWLSDQADLVRGTGGARSAWHGVIVDISAQKQREAELAHRALHDPLTGLPNRTLFFDRLGQALARTRRTGGAVGVLVLDLDDFKAVNDRFGHVVGDQVLVEVGRRLRATLRPGDTAARLGGDEFAAVLDGVRDATGAERAAERIAAALWSPIVLAAGEARVAASVGAAVGRAGADSPEALVAQADAAMYRAKRLAGAHHGLFRPNGEVATTLPDAEPFNGANA